MKRSTKRWLGAIVVLLIAGGLVYANFAFRKETGKEVTVETIQTRDLTAIVTASGKIQKHELVRALTGAGGDPSGTRDGSAGG